MRYKGREAMDGFVPWSKNFEGDMLTNREPVMFLEDWDGMVKFMKPSDEFDSSVLD